MARENTLKLYAAVDRYGRHIAQVDAENLKEARPLLAELIPHMLNATTRWQENGEKVRKV